MRYSSAIITARAVAGRDAGGTHAARAAADDEEIDVEFSHCPSDLFSERSDVRDCSQMVLSDFLATLAHLGAELRPSTISEKFWAHEFMNAC